MARFWKAISAFLAIILISASHITSVHVLPYPISLVNIVMMFALVTLFTFETGLVVWTSAIAFFVLDLYTTSTPFGITLVAGTLSILFGYWFHIGVFTNRSWWASMALTALTLGMYRVMYVIALFFIELTTALEIRWSDLYIGFLWENIVTSILVGIIIFVLSFFIRSLRVKTVEHTFFVIR